jgi:hypothetical protein
MCFALGGAWLRQITFLEATSNFNYVVAGSLLLALANPLVMIS